MSVITVQDLQSHDLQIKADLLRQYGAARKSLMAARSLTDVESAARQISQILTALGHLSVETTASDLAVARRAAAAVK